MPLKHPDKKTIDWLYHQNPFGGENEYVEEKDAKVSDFMPAYSDDDNEEDGFSPQMVNESFAYRRVKPFAVLPGGLVPIDFYTDTTKAMELWMAHTNFRVNDEVLSIVENVPGVESVEYATPYSFRVGFARGFRDADGKTSHLRRDIESELGVFRTIAGIDGDVRKSLDEIRDAANTASLTWVANLMPNNNIVYAFCDGDEEFTTFLNIYREAADAVGGVTYSTNNYK